MTQELAGGVPIDSLFRANAGIRPNAIAIADPANRADFTDGAPLRITYAEMDARVEKLACTLRSFGMPPGSVVAVQLPNIAEAVIALLAVMRAGHVAASVPMLWRRSELVAALAGLAPRAMITLSRLNGERPAQTMCEAAADLFDLSFPCAFGGDVPDGVVPLDRHDGSIGRESPHDDADTGGVSLLTFDTDAEGFFPVGRSDAQWLAAGLSVLLEAEIASGDTVVATMPPASLAAVGGALIPWLLSGGMMELAHGRAPEMASTHAHLIAPAAAAESLLRARNTPFSSCVAVHRNPANAGQRFSRATCGRIVDLYSFGESGFVALRRDEANVPRSIPVGGVSAPSEAVSAPVVIETRLAGGQLWLRGPMVPLESWPPGLSAFRTARDSDGFLRTGYRAGSDGNGGLTIHAGPDRVVTVGGLRFGLDDLRTRFAGCGEDVKVTAIGDPLLGERLHIEAIDREAAAAALLAAGHSQLVIDAAIGTAERRAAG